MVSRQDQIFVKLNWFRSGEPLLWAPPPATLVLPVSMVVLRRAKAVGLGPLWVIKYTFTSRKSLNICTSCGQAHWEGWSAGGGRPTALDIRGPEAKRGKQWGCNLRKASKIKCVLSWICEWQADHPSQWACPHVECIILVNREVVSNTVSLTPPLFIDMSVPNQEWMTISCSEYEILHTEVAPSFKKEPTNDFHRALDDV
jgi:hypothetical protein